MMAKEDEIFMCIIPHVMRVEEMWKISWKTNETKTCFGCFITGTVEFISAGCISIWKGLKDFMEDWPTSSYWRWRLQFVSHRKTRRKQTAARKQRVLPCVSPKHSSSFPSTTLTAFILLRSHRYTEDTLRAFQTVLTKSMGIGRDAFNKSSDRGLDSQSSPRDGFGFCVLGQEQPK